MSRMGARAVAAVLVLTAVGAVLRFATIAQQTYWYDETVTASLVDGSLVDVFRGVVDTESTPPLYYVLAWIWAQVVGIDEAQLRSFSALVGTLVVPVAFAAGRVAASVRVGLAAAALAAVSPMLIWYSQEARAYALVALLSGASFVLFLTARTEPSRRRLVTWAAVSALAVATHYFAAFVILAEALLLLRAHPRERGVRWAVGAIGAVAACLLPLAAVQASHRRLGWVGGIELQERVTEAVQRFVVAGQPSSWWGATGADVTPHVWLGAVGVLLLAGVLVVRRASAEERRGAVLGFRVAAVGIGLPVAMALVADVLAGGDGDYFLDRNVLAAWVPLAVFVAGGLAARGAGLVGTAVLAAVVVWSVVAYVDVVSSPELQRDDWRAVAEALPKGASQVIVYPAYQSAALIRQREDLTEQTGSLTTDTVTLVLVGSSRPPSSFRVPEGFVESSSDELQHFVLVAFRRDVPTSVGPDDVAAVPLDEADLAVLVTDPPSE